MDLRHARTFVTVADFQKIPCEEEWIPQNPIARFIRTVVGQLDLSAFNGAYRGSGSKAYPPATLLAFLLYGYLTGVFSSRKFEAATYDSMAFAFFPATRTRTTDPWRRSASASSASPRRFLPSAPLRECDGFGQAGLGGVGWLQDSGQRQQACSDVHRAHRKTGSLVEGAGGHPPGGGGEGRQQ